MSELESHAHEEPHQHRGDGGSPRTAAPPPTGEDADSSLSARAHHAADEPEPLVAERAGKLAAISLDMGPGYAAAARWHAPQAVICIDPYHVVHNANKALDEIRRAYWNELRESGDPQAAKRFKDARWSLLKAPSNLTDKQAATLHRIKAARGEVWRAYTLKEAARAIFAPGLTVTDVEILTDRLLSRLACSRLEPFIRLGKTIRKHRAGILAAIRLGINLTLEVRAHGGHLAVGDEVVGTHFAGEGHKALPQPHPDGLKVLGLIAALVKAAPRHSTTRSA